MSSESVTSVVAPLINEASHEIISTSDASADNNPTTTSTSSGLPNVASCVLEMHDVVVVPCSNGSYRLARVSEICIDGIKVIYFIGPKYSIDIKQQEENIILE